MTSEETSIGQRSTDFPKQFAIGVNSSIKALSDFFGADSPISQNLNKNVEWYRNLLSAQAQKNEAEIARILQEAEGKGMLEELEAGVSAFSTAPADFIASGLGSVSTFVATGIAGRTIGFLKSTQMATGMTMGAGAVKGQIYETVKEEMMKMGKDKDESQRISMEAQSTLGKNLPNILAGAGLGAANARLGAELIISKVLTKGGLEASASRVKSIVANGFMEGAPELAQSAQQKFSENLSLRLEGLDIPLTQGIYSQAAMEGLSGTAVGMIAGGVEPRVAQKSTNREPTEMKARSTQTEKKLSIYFDLDETLIHANYTQPYSQPPKERTRITLTGRNDSKQEHYDSILRPHAKHMLAFCRELGEVKLLTTANKEYATKHNQTFDLGFKENQILAREDYLKITQTEYGPVYDPSKKNTDPNAFLIDNLPPDKDAPQLKMQFLGIERSNYIQIREFSGNDPKIFTKELGQILINLENHKLGKHMEQEQSTPQAPSKVSIIPNMDNPHLGININESIALRLHNIWLETHKKEVGGKKFKPINDPEIQDLEILSFRGKRVPKQDLVPHAKTNDRIEHILVIRTKDLQEFDVAHKNLYDCELILRDDPEKGAYLRQNIAQEPHLLNPALMEKLNGKMANKYLETIVPDIMEMDKKSFDKCLEDISSQIHDIWVEENKSWAPEEQKVPYSQLPEFEKEKDRQVARTLFETTQEVKTIEKLKGIEIQAAMEPLSNPNQENIKKASTWIKEINDCQKTLINSPWHKQPSLTLSKLKDTMTSEVYTHAYKEFERSILNDHEKTKIITRPQKDKQPLNYEPSIGM